MRIEWAHLGQPAFDRLVELILYRVVGGEGCVEAVNGRGGDGGIDVRIVRGDELEIVQLKFYPEGFPTSARGRRSSIRASFARAAKQRPQIWTLVLPCNVSDPERDFVMGLGGGAPTPRIRIVDRAQLDAYLTFYPSIAEYWQRDSLMEAAKIYGQETAFLIGGAADLGKRVQALGQRVDDLDTHWSLDFARQGEAVVQTLRPQHPLAAEVSPIHLHLTTRTEGTQREVAERLFGFGTAEALRLSASEVEEFRLEGPEWLRQTSHHVAVEIRPMLTEPTTPREVELVFRDLEGQEVASFGAVVKSVGRGGTGRSVEVIIHGRGAMRLLLPHDATQPAKLGYTFQLEGLTPSEALQLLELRRLLFGPGHFSLEADGHQGVSGRLPDLGDDPGALAEVDALLAYIEDLDFVQRHCRRFFPVDFDISWSDRLWVRRARLLIEGKCVTVPHRSWTVTLNGSDSTDLRSTLRECGALMLESDRCAIPVGRRTLNLGRFAVYHPRMHAENGTAAEAALDCGTAAGFRVVYTPPNGEHLRAYLPDATPPDQPLAPTPLELPGAVDLA
ncbi:hypothetical protein PYK79_48170 [Streptomyces sp. ID05-04B]|uniref:hypothetical protein n=1 Tax=Streptomyces sp. ID05-04B TaxID=3028661 RepID=UPI0029C1F206|nr:hypothetical protein [Streptomyces sp. ID05-04B]MDX5569483.1 hypothetical protein [Streptomyces sp. ID05-04B]